MDICYRENYLGKFGDKRLDRRANKVSSLLYFGVSSSIHRSTPDESEQKAVYRFLANDRVSEEILIETAKEKSEYFCAGRDVLVIQDTTEINLQRHHGRLKTDSGIGVTGNNHDQGFFFHGSLVLDAATSMMLGYSDIQLWHRSPEKLDKKQRDYKNLPIVDKESYRWIKACKRSQEHLLQARSITIIEDREGDIFEQFATIPDDRTHLIVRSRDNRRLMDGGKLFERLAAEPVQGSYTIDVVKDIHKGVQKRKARVEVRFCQAGILKPKNVKTAGLANHVSLHVVEVREIDGPTSGGILWRILTTHVIRTYEQAVDIVNKYRQRWHIEQIFRLLKTKGFQIESSELETGWAIRKLTVMIANAALRVMQLRMAHANEESQPIEEVFDEEEIKCLQAANNSVQGATKILTNNNPPGKLSWAAWIIGRLGGWKPYDRYRPPGPIILKRGLEKFDMMYLGWKMAHRKDVS